ncbi:unnamed protein product [Amoebophrya sp. A120]|nr:unnamed protein product [Amoebophrya sp. A120]|eukprot:GSA120T00014191001.1
MTLLTSTCRSVSSAARQVAPRSGTKKEQTTAYNLASSPLVRRQLRDRSSVGFCGRCRQNDRTGGSTRSAYQEQEVHPREREAELQRTSLGPAHDKITDDVPGRRRGGLGPFFSPSASSRGEAPTSRDVNFHRRRSSRTSERRNMSMKKTKFLTCSRASSPSTSFSISFVFAFLQYLYLLSPVGVVAQIHILSPKSLRDEFHSTQATVYGTTATFGAPYFGARVIGKILYGESKNGNNHCDADDYSIEESQMPNEDSNLMPIVLVQRGKCSFAKKVKVAEEAKKASAVIIIDKESSGKTSEQIQATIMADDESGTGQNVKIPSILISYFEGNKLINAVRKAEEENEAVLVKLAWDIPQSNYVLADFWFSSGSREANRFLKNFAELAESFKELLSFVPHYHIISLPAESDTMSLCLETEDEADKNKFCAADPDGAGTATGRQVVEEDLRQICLFKNSEKWTNPEVKQSGELFGYSEAFWKYLRAFWKQCTDSGRDFTKFTKKCSYEVMEQINGSLSAKNKIDIDNIKQCTKKDWKSLLKKEIRNHAWSPLALRINGWRYSGPIESNLVMRSICGGYLKRPEQCERFAQLVAYTGTGASDNLMTFTKFFVLLGIVLIFFFILFHVYKKYLTSSVRHALREEVMLEVRSQMADYAPLEDGPTQVREMKKFSF